MKIGKFIVALLITNLVFLAGCGDAEKVSLDIGVEETLEKIDNAFVEVYDSSSIIVSTIKGMIWIPASDSIIVLGTNDSSAKANEKPEMRVSLDYGFYMGVHEVSCEDYAALILSQNLKKIEGCTQDSLPVTNFNYYDAILLANAQSKQMHYDSVYSYVSAKFDDDNHCTYLEGLNFHPDKEGFRLPTEAEWVRAASMDWNVDNSWNADNSDYKVHNICSRRIDSAGFCDLSGNVMEWVNDWLGNFKDTIIADYMGNMDGGDIGERVLKGGSFRLNAASINKYNRGDVYMVTSTSFGDYVGFRLALGKIEKPVWLSKDGSVEQSKITVSASLMSIKTVVGSYSVKLAFRDDVTGNLAYIDYLEGGGSVVEIVDTLNVYHPDISPDGKRVAFCTKPEGVSGKSSLYVRNLDEIGENIVKLNVESAAIPRWHVSLDGDTSIVYVSDAGVNSDPVTWKSYTTWQVPFVDGKFGVPQKLFDGSYHGGLSEDEKMTVTGARLLRARIEGLDTLWLNGEQACNASLAIDGTKKTLFLDFGSKSGRAFVGQSYGVHERILIADSLGNLIQSIGAPEGFSFDHSEWASDGVTSNIVATLANINGSHEKIVLVNVRDSSIIDLVEGDELWHPCLWVKRKVVASNDNSQTVKSSSSITSLAEISSSSTIQSSTAQESSLSDSAQGSTAQETSSGDVQVESSSSDDSIQSSSAQESSSSEEDFALDADSAGIYYLPGGNEQSLILRYKMELLWKYKDSANVVIMGSSRAYYGVNPLVLSKPFWGLNVAVPSTTIRSSLAFCERYVLPQVENLKYLVISIDPDRGGNDGYNNQNVFYQLYKEFPGYVYDMNHDYWKNGYIRGLYEATFDSPGNDTYAKKLRNAKGFHSISTQGWGEPVVLEDSCWMDTKSAVLDSNIQLFKDLVGLCQKKNIVVVGVLFPTNPKYQETGALGYAGLRRSEAPAVIKRIESISDEFTNFVLMDENKMGSHDYGDSLAHDYSHLSYTGANRFTARLDSLLKTLQ